MHLFGSLFSILFIQKYIHCWKKAWALFCRASHASFFSFKISFSQAIKWTFLRTLTGKLIYALGSPRRVYLRSDQAPGEATFFRVSPENSSGISGTESSLRRVSNRLYSLLRWPKCFESSRIERQTVRPINPRERSSSRSSPPIVTWCGCPRRLLNLTKLSFVRCKNEIYRLDYQCTLVNLRDDFTAGAVRWNQTMGMTKSAGRNYCTRQVEL